MKNNFDRRNVLKGLLTLPGAAAVGGLMISCGKNEGNANSKLEASPNNSKEAATSTIVDFSVVLHGAYALQFDTDKEKVQILIPTVLEGGKEAHTYKRGLFGNEIDLPSGDNTAILVSANNPLPDVLKREPTSGDPSKLVIVRKKELKPADKRPLRNKFELPYPRALTVLRAQQFNKRAPRGQTFFEFENEDLIPKKPTQVPMSLALQYDLIVPVPFPVPNFHLHLHLHTFAEQVVKDKHGKHITTGFAAITSLYDGKLGGLKLAKAVVDDVDKPLKDSIMDDMKFARAGFEAGEGLSLEQREAVSSVTGGARVGGCAGVIVVSGKDA